MSDDKVVDFTRKRVDRTQDCRDWTVADALRAALDAIESGEIKNPKRCYLTIRDEDEEENSYLNHYYAAGCSHLEVIGLLALNLIQRVIDQ